MVSCALLTAHLRIRELCMVTGSAAVIRVSLLVTMVSSYGLQGVGYSVGLALAAENAVLVWLALRIVGVPWHALLPHAWRPVLATAAMALGLWWTGLGWNDMPAQGTAALVQLAEAVAAGAAVYAGVAGTLWLVAGRPAGAEADMLSVLRQAAAAQQLKLRQVMPKGGRPFRKGSPEACRRVPAAGAGRPPLSGKLSGALR